MRSQSKGQHLLELQVSFLNAAMSTESEPTKPGVSNPIHTMPHKTSELLEYYTQLFPEEKDESSEEMELDNTDAQDPSPPPGDVSGQLPQAPPDWRSAGGKSYKAAGGFQRMDMDNLCDEANAIGQRKTQTVDPRGTATGSSWYGRKYCELNATNEFYTVYLSIQDKHLCLLMTNSSHDIHIMPPTHSRRNHNFAAAQV